MIQGVTGSGKTLVYFERIKEVLKRKKLINCIYCGSTSVQKTVMSPNLTSKSNKDSKNYKIEKSFV